MQFKEEIADLEGRPALTDDEHILDHIAGKLQMYDSEFHKYHYRLVDYMDDEVELQVQRSIFHDNGRRMMSCFKRTTNLRSQKRIITPLPKPAEETTYIGAYNSCPQLITSRKWISDDSIDQTKVKTVESGILVHLLQQVNKLQIDLEVIIRELIGIRHQDNPLPEAIDLDKVLREL